MREIEYLEVEDISDVGDPVLGQVELNDRFTPAHTGESGDLVVVEGQVVKVIESLQLRGIHLFNVVKFNSNKLSMEKRLS